MKTTGSYGGEEMNALIEAAQNALEFIEALGYKDGDVHDDLAKAIKDVTETTPTA